MAFGNSPTSIRRKNGQRILTVTARVDPTVVTRQEVNQVLRAGILSQPREAVGGPPRGPHLVWRR